MRTRVYLFMAAGLSAFTLAYAQAPDTEVSDDGEKMTLSAVQTDTQGRVVSRIERVFVRKH